jgi:hydroxyquinol 1,2-dioxygenase
VATTRTAPSDITNAVVASFDGCPDQRLREVVQAFVRHLHGFAIEVGLTQEEWEAGVRLLTETGNITDERRQEFILWSDALGLSMLVDTLAHPPAEGATESTVLGPFYVPGSPEREYGASMTATASSTPALVHGRVLDLGGRPIAGAEVDVWQNGENGLYAVQDAEAAEDHLRGLYRTREDGSYAFLGVRPIPYTIPDDGPVGDMLRATAREAWRPAHIHMIVRAPGYRTLATHIFDSTSDHLASDAVHAVKPSLLREFVPRSADDPGRPAGVEGEWFSVANDIVLMPSADAGEPIDPGRTA